MPAVIMPDGQRDDGDAHERGDHGDGASHVGGGVEVAVADGREGDDSPVDGIEEGVEGFRFDVEDDEGADEDVADRQAEDGEQGFPLFLEDGGDGGGALRVANEFEGRAGRGRGEGLAACAARR